MTAGDRLHDRLRSLIFEAAADAPEVGDLTESLKWGEPSFTPAKPRIGSSVRLARRDGETVAMMFICHTHLVDRFREIYPDTFRFEGNRALVFDADEGVDETALKHCIAMALTYHLQKRKSR